MAYEDKYAAAELPHNIVLDRRGRLSVSGVTDIASFNEQEVVAETSMGTLIIRGEALHMEKLSVDSGDVMITGRVDSMEYEDPVPTSESFFARLFR